MSDLAIRVAGLSKRYRIGSRQPAYHTFRERLEELIRTSLRRNSCVLRGKGTGKETVGMFWALKDLSFDVKQGEIIGVVGRNGAGKTTLLRILSRITEPNEGVVEITGRLGSLLEVGTGFHPELTGRENVYLNGAILGMTREEMRRKFDDIVGFSEVERFIDTPVKHYSTGMAVRLGFAVAAHLDLDILLVDEVLAVGDAGFQKKCLGRMDDLGQSGRTVILVSHNMATIERHCSRVIWLEEGSVRADGDPTEVIKKYLRHSSIDHSGLFDLREIPRAGGTGAVRYTRVEFIGDSGVPTEVLRTGDRVNVRLHYSAVKALAYPYFGIEIYSEMGTLIANMNTWTSGAECPSLPKGDGYIDVQLQSFNVAPGRYYLSLWVAGVGPVWHDKIDRSVAINVEAADYYHSGRAITNKLGLVVFPCIWRFNGCSTIAA